MDEDRVDRTGTIAADDAAHGHVLRVDRYSQAERGALAAEFAAATPFPHAVLPDLLDLDPTAVARFPGPQWPGWHRFGDEYQRRKYTCDDIERIPEPFAAIIRESMSPRFLAFLEQLTSIPKLIPDPYLTGGGLHLSTAGGVLAPHTDFHLYERLDLHRRINVLLYLNPGWTPELGGQLELTSESRSERRVVVPTWGTCVVFETNDESVHGVPTAVADGHQRRSIALYYYTSAETGRYAGDTTTYWRTHGEQTGARRLRLSLYRSLLFGSKALAKVAHRVNPILAAGAPHRDGDDERA